MNRIVKQDQLPVGREDWYREFTCTLCAGTKRVASYIGGGITVTCGRCAGYGVLYEVDTP